MTDLIPFFFHFVGIILGFVFIGKDAKEGNLIGHQDEVPFATIFWMIGWPFMFLHRGIRKYRSKKTG